MTRITGAFIGKTVTFHGYDGRDYLARILRVYRGIVTIQYEVSGAVITTYISNLGRLSHAG